MPRKAKTPKPSQGRLPGTEDAAIEALEVKAEQYAKIRDKRQALTEQEVNLKQELLLLMQQEEKEHYLHGNVEITLVPENMKVKVRIKKDEDE